MNSAKNVVIGLLALTTVGAALLAWREHERVAELRGTAVNPAERADLQKKLWALQKENQNLTSRLAATGRNGSGTGTASSTDTGPGDARDDGGRMWRGRGGAEAAAIREVMAKPEVQAMMTSARKAVLDQQYAPLLRALNLPPEQSDRLLALLAERQNTLQDVMSAAREQGVNPRSDPAGFRKLVSDAEGSVNDSIKSLLGDTGYSQFTNYEQTMPQRNVVNALQQRLSATDAPLTTTQSDQLVQILAANAPQNAGTTATPSLAFDGPRGGPDFGGRMGAVVAGVGSAGSYVAAIAPGSAPITAEAVAQAQTVLSAPQVAALKQMQQQQQNAQQLQQMIRSAADQAGGGAAPGPGAPRRPPGG